MSRHHDRQEQISRTVYVGNIDRGVSASDVIDFFSVCGPIAFIRLDGDAFRGNRSAFVEFLARESAVTALRLTGRTFINTKIRVAPSENAIQRPQIELTHEEEDKIDTALRHIKRRIRRWEKVENPSEYESKRDRKRRRRKHRSHDSGSDYSSEEERDRKKRRRKHRNDEELDEDFVEHPKRLSAMQDMRTDLLHFQKDLNQRQIKPERFTLPENYPIEALSSADKVDKWIEDNIKPDTMVGMDCEWDCTEDERGYPHVISIATEEACLLYQVPSKHHRIPNKLLDLFIDSKVKKIWCENQISMEKIRRWLDRRLEGEAILQEIALELRTPKSHVDISHLVNEKEVKGLRRIAFRYIAKVVEEDLEAMSSRWSRYELSEAQKKYAAEDAYVLLQVYKVLAK